MKINIWIVPILVISINCSNPEKNSHAEMVNILSKNAIDIDPEYDQYYFVRGQTKSELQDFTSAIKDYSKAIKLDPKEADNYKWRGVAKEETGNLKGALSDWNKALKLSDDDEVKQWIAENKQK